MSVFFFRLCDGGFEAGIRNNVLIKHSIEKPFLRAGFGEGRFEMFRGNFRISEHEVRMTALTYFRVLSISDDGAEVAFGGGAIPPIAAAFALEDGRLTVRFSMVPPSDGKIPNRFRISLPCSASDHVYGCGEQFSRFNLKGWNFPLWTSEQGVGRNKDTKITRLADLDGGGGGDYYWTFFPQTSFISSSGRWYSLDTTAYAEFDFRAPESHELYSWALPRKLVVGAASTMRDLVSDLSVYYGRQGSLPSWCHEGVILGIQGGTAACLKKLASSIAANVKVAGIWAQDWQGVNMTSFGQRLRWNWEWDSIRYPKLQEEITRLRREGIRFLGYINPYVGAGMSLFLEAASRGFLAKDKDGSDYLVDFGEFFAGIVDFTNPAAFDWYKSIIKRNLIGFGLSGWMADFGEYLPTDAVLFDGSSAEIRHNEWPALWARCNREAVDEAEREGLVSAGEIVYFMRAGAAGSQKFCPLMWAGDQNVDWSEDDGLPSVIPAALSLGMSGHGLHHSDIGGYTTLYGMKRSKELFMRWAELAAFTSMMRSHEGNRPADNWQFDSDDETLAHLAGMSALHAALAPYFSRLERENAESGLPVMRPLFLHYENDERAWTLKDEYLLGEDLLVAPIVTEGATERTVHFPPGAWIHLWSGTIYRSEKDAPGAAEPGAAASGDAVSGAAAADFMVQAPLGEPPCFAREGSEWLALFHEAAKEARSRYSCP